ncbi:MAG: DNA polymerase III subunit delta [Clostridia bacterium]|nr:DNA polymerase III subunit delta [Clostridia bacterium]
MILREEHAYKTFQKMLQSCAFPSALLLFGEEGYLIDWAVNEMKSALLNPASLSLDLNCFSEEALIAGDIINACETVPMLSARKIVIAENCDIFFANQSAEVESDAQRELREYIKTLPPSTLLILTARKVDKRRSLYKTIVKCGLAYEFGAIDGKTLTDFIRKRIKAAGKTASEQSIKAFIDMTGYTDRDSGYRLYNMVNDIHKAVALSQNVELTALDFQESVAGNADTDAFALLDAAFLGDKGKAFALLKNIIAAEGQTYSTGAILRLLGLICSQLEIMLIAKERLADGEDFGSLSSSMGIKSFRLQKALEASGKRTIDQLSRNLRDAFLLERDIKSSSRSAELTLELFIASL